ncbi:MAG: SDR family NAD(P)-dependent oxidoreductase, partial [Acetobacteraceae bacterium]
MTEGSTHTAVARYPSLVNKAILVTGGASGIGAAVVEAFAQQGARVFFLDLDQAAGEALVRRLGGNVTFRPVDLTDIERLRGAIRTIEQELGGAIDVLVNDAARDDRHDWA